MKRKSPTKAELLATARAERWQFEEWLDLHPPMGAFVSTTRSDFTYRGEKINALNWLHAEHTFWKRKIEESGGEWERCAHCNHVIRYAVFVAPEGAVDEDSGQNRGPFRCLGQDCAALILSGLDPEKWREKQLLSDMREVETSRGKRFVLSFRMVSSHWEWFWEIPRDQRPKFVSLRKGEPLRRGDRPPWFLSIWGETGDEVIENYRTFQDQKRAVKKS